MDKILVFICLLFVFIPLTVSQDLANERQDFHESKSKNIFGAFTYYSLEQETLNIQHKEQDKLNTFDSFYINSSRPIHIDLVLNKSSFKPWKNKHDLEYYEYHVVADSGKIHRLNWSAEDDEYISNIVSEHEELLIHVIGQRDINSNVGLAIHPKTGDCGRYLNPGEKFNNVNNCQEGFIQIIDNIYNNNFDSNRLSNKTLGFAALLILIASILIYFNVVHTKNNEIQKTTEEIIDKMESNKMPKNKNILQKLNRANQQAYEGNYKKANKLLAEIKSDLNS